MPRNGSGTYSLPAGNPVTTNTVISSTVQNNTMSDIATALTQSLTKDGQTTSTANQPMGGFKLTNLGNGSAATDSLNLGQAQSSASQVLSAVSGTNTIVGSLNPTLTAYANGQTFRFVAAASNTGAVTININSLGAKSITKDGATALVTGDILINGLYEISYDGTQFQLINSSATFQGGTVTGDITMSSAMDKWAKGADVASATALPLITDGNYFDVTGTTTVTSFNSVGVGTLVILRFTASLTLTHNSTDLILPNGVNIKTAAGDVAGFVEYASGDYRCIWYTRAGSPSTVRLNTANGYGSTNTAIRRFTNTVTNQGADITYADSSTLGASFTINNSGVYAISYSDNFSVGANLGVSLNSTQLTTSINSITAADRLFVCDTSTGNATNASATTVALSAGDVIRAHTNAVSTGTVPAAVQFTITRVA